MPTITPQRVTTSNSASKPKRPVLVTGAPRSGTTWTGRMLALAEGLHYIHEPFNNQFRESKPYLFGPPLPAFFYYVCGENAESVRPYLESTMRMEAWDTENVPRGDTTIKEWVKARKHGCVPLIKDPIACMSAEWLAEEFDMQVVIVVRHPAAVVQSLLRLGWNVRPLQLLRQSLLTRNELEALRPVIDSWQSSDDSVVHASLLWAMIYEVLDRYAGRNPGWIVVRHEDLALNPLREFEDLYRRLGLEFTNSVRDEVWAHCGGHNEAFPKAHWKVKRNSAANVGNWHGSLDAKGIRTIREITEQTAAGRYYASDWS